MKPLPRVIANVLTRRELKERTAMSKKEQFIKEQRTARTVKVRSLVVGLLVAIAIITAFISGWFVRSDFDSTIRSQVNAQVQQLKAVK